MYDPEGITIAIGILLGMFYFRQTGESPGGIITPGLVALRFSDPQALCLSLGCALLLGVALRFFFRRFPVYGRQRVAFAMLCALVVRLVLPVEWGPDERGRPPALPAARAAWAVGRTGGAARGCDPRVHAVARAPAGHDPLGRCGGRRGFHHRVPDGNRPAAALDGARALVGVR